MSSQSKSVEDTGFVKTKNTRLEIFLYISFFLFFFFKENQLERWSLTEMENCGVKGFELRVFTLSFLR
jgi:hypothetical protein